MCRTLLVVGATKGISSVISFLRENNLKQVVMRNVYALATSVDSSVTSQIEDQVINGMIPKEVLQSESNTELPEVGIPSEKLLSLLETWSAKEHTIWGEGKASGAIYHGEMEFLETLTKAYSLFALSNPLHPELFPWIRKMESEVVRMTLSLFHGDEYACGFMTSGGTESILMAMKAYRDRARVEKHIVAPEVIVCETVHCAFDKAANYFGITLVSLPADPVTQELRPSDVEKAITKNTIAIVGSAPGFPHGVVDPIPELGALALKYDIGLHVDCCLGSFLIPYASKLGADIPYFDFRVPGVTSISADTHKYGFAPKGSSVIMYRTADLRKYMYYINTKWTGGVYASPTITGSRAGALVASTWAALMCMGKQGYEKHFTEILHASTLIRDTLMHNTQFSDKVKVIGNSKLSVIAFTTTTCCVYAVSSEMGKRNWHLNALQNPKCVHLCVTYANCKQAEQFLQDLHESILTVEANPDKYKKSNAVLIYGLAESIGHTQDSTGTSTGLVADMARIYIDTLTYIPPPSTSTTATTATTSLPSTATAGTNTTTTTEPTN